MGLGIAAAAIMAGGAVYAAHEQGQAADDAAGRFSNMMSWVPKVDPAKFERLSNPWDTFRDYFHEARAILPTATNFADRANKAYQGNLYAALPGLRDTLYNSSRYAAELSDGRISADTANAVSRSSAYKALQGGLGAGSDGGNALTARDLGRTVEQQKAAGAAYAPGMLQIAQALTPLKATDLIMSPQQLLSRADANTEIANREIAFNKSLEMENANAQYQGQMTQAGIQAQNDMAQGQSRAQIGTAVANFAGGVVGGMGNFGGGGMPSTGGIDWTKIGANFGGSGQYASGFYATQGSAQSAGGGAFASPGGTSPTTYYPGKGWSIGFGA